jgi:hypothetical protein
MGGKNKYWLQPRRIAGMWNCLSSSYNTLPVTVVVNGAFVSSGRPCMHEVCCMQVFDVMMLIK